MRIAGTAETRPAEGERPGASTAATLAFDTEFLRKLERLELLARKIFRGHLRGEHTGRRRGTGIEFFDFRRYQPGDDVRSIDWNVTARTGVPYVKRYAEERELTLHLLVDTSSSMDFGSRRWTKREAAAQVAALIAFVAMQHQDRVGLTLFGAEVPASEIAKLRSALPGLEIRGP